MFLAAALCVAASLAAPFEAEIGDPEVITDLSAYTVHKGQWRLGLASQDVGITERFSVGTSAALWPFGVLNGHAKATVVDTDRFDVSAQGGYYGVDLERLIGVPEGMARYTPLGVTGSLRTSSRGTLHGGADLLSLRLEGGMDASELAGSLALLAGTDFDTDIFDEALEAVGADAAFAAEADLHMTRLRLAYDHRIGPRDTLMVTVNRAMGFGGDLQVGSTVSGSGGEQVSLGAAVDVDYPIADALPTVVSVAWQHSWRRVHARVGIPLTSQANMLLAVGGVMQLELLLGPVPGTSEG